MNRQTSNVPRGQSRTWLPPGPNDCTVTLPVEIDVQVMVRSLCKPWGSSRTRGGMTTEILEIDEKIDAEKEIGPSMLMKPMSILQEIIKKQRHILAGLATDGPLNFYKQGKSLHEIQNKINNDEQQHNYELLNDNAGDDNNDKQTQTHKKETVRGNRNKFHPENYKNNNEQVKTIASSSIRKSHNRKNHTSYIEKYLIDDSFESQILSSLVSDLELLETDDDDDDDNSNRDIQEKTKRKSKRLKGGDDVMGIPYDIKKAAMLKGAKMCRTRLSKVALAKRKIKSAHRRFSQKSMERLKCDRIDDDDDDDYENSQDNDKFFKKSATKRKKRNGRISKRNYPFGSRLDTKLSRLRLKGGMDKLSNNKKHSKCRRACNCFLSHKNIKNRKFSKNKEDIYGWLEKLEDPLSKENAMHMEGYNMRSSLSKSDFKKKIHQPLKKNKKNVSEPLSSSSSKNSLNTKNKEITTLYKAKSNKINKTENINNKHCGSDLKPKYETNQKSSYEKIFELFKIHRSRSKFHSKIVRQSKSRICACCMHRKPANAGQTLAISRSNLKENFVNDVGDSREISLYKNTITKFSKAHKKRTLADPLDTLTNVSEKLEELQSLTGKPPGMDSKTVVVNHDMFHSFTGRRKRKQTRRFYDSHRKLQEYEKCYSETSSSNSDSTFI